VLCQMQSCLLLLLRLAVVRCMPGIPGRTVCTHTHLYTMPVCRTDPAHWRNSYQVMAEVHKHIHAAPVPQGISTWVTTT
jgi:hypothetical protein